MSEYGKTHKEEEEDGDDGEDGEDGEDGDGAMYNGNAASKMEDTYNSTTSRSIKSPDSNHQSSSTTSSNNQSSNPTIIAAAAATPTSPHAPAMQVLFDQPRDAFTPSTSTAATAPRISSRGGKSGTASCRCSAMLDLAECEGGLGVAASQFFDAGYTSMLQHMMDVDVALRNGTVVMGSTVAMRRAHGGDDDQVTTTSFHTDGTVTYHFAV